MGDQILAKIALRVGRRVIWDAKAERIANDDEANRLLTYQYREPWRLG